LAVSLAAGNSGGSDSFQPGVFGGAAYYQNSTQSFVYFCGGTALATVLNAEGNFIQEVTCGQLRSFPMSQSTLDFAGATQTTDQFLRNGATPFVSSNGNVPKSAIVWAVDRNQNTPTRALRLFAFNAENLRDKLLEVDATPWTNPGGVPFIEPTVINGQIYVGGSSQVVVFGLPKG